jgi:hypothetical protein
MGWSGVEKRKEVNGEHPPGKARPHSASGFSIVPPP